VITAKRVETLEVRASEARDQVKKLLTQLHGTGASEIGSRLPSRNSLDLRPHRQRRDIRGASAIHDQCCASTTARAMTSFEKWVGITIVSIILAETPPHRLSMHYMCCGGGAVFHRLDYVGRKSKTNNECSA
jgi:hypothetical protein